MFSRLFAAESVSYTFLTIAVVAIVGLALGSIRIRGIGLGVAAVLFAGIIAGHLGARFNPAILQFARDAGLVLFVYSIGAEAGPGFLASLRRSGLKFNALAVMTLLLGCVLAVALGRALKLPGPVLAGIYSGAVTNTPALAAAQQVLGTTSPGSTELPGLGYALAYPGGVFGIIISMLIARALFRATNGRTEFPRAAGGDLLGSINIKVTQPDWMGRSLGEAIEACSGRLTVSRHFSKGSVGPAHATNILREHDVVLAVGPQQDLERFADLLGCASAIDLRSKPSELSVRRIIVTRRQAQREIGDVLAPLRGAVATRVRRGGLEFAPSPELQLQFGDVVQVVGGDEGIAHAIELLGNSTRQLDHPQLIAVALGIALGVLLGSVPIPIPGVPVSIKLGLAGGPLIAALLLSRIGRIGPVVWYLPRSANFIMRELGMVVFLACVGIKSGEHFVETLRNGNGLLWMAVGLAITVLPLLVLTVAARLVGLRFMSTCGLLAGSMTDPPALAFASAFGAAEKAYVAYAAVYPLMMILRVISAQLLVAWCTT